MPCWKNKFSVLECEECIDDKSIVNTLTADASSPTAETSEVISPGLVLRAHRKAKQSFEILVILEKVDTTTPFGTPALVDSGASGNFIDLDYAQSRGFKIDKLPRSISLYNIDGTLNSQGAVQVHCLLDPQGPRPFGTYLVVRY